MTAFARATWIGLSVLMSVGSQHVSRAEAQDGAVELVVERAADRGMPATRRAIARRQSALAACGLGRGGVEGAGGAGGVVLTVDPSGRVTRVMLSGDDDDQTVFRACITRALGSIRFVPVAAETTIVGHLAVRPMPPAGS
jgi:hypothetical protein